MNLVSIAAVGVRLLSLLVLFYVLRESSRLISLATGFHSYDEWPLYAMFVAVFALAGVWLWVAAVSIAKRIIPKGAEIESEATNDLSRPTYQLAFVLLGMYVLIYGVSEFSYTAQVYLSLPEEHMTPDQAKKLLAAMLSSLLEVLFGLILIFGARRISALIYKIRYGGQ